MAFKSLEMLPLLLLVVGGAAAASQVGGRGGGGCAEGRTPRERKEPFPHTVQIFWATKKIWKKGGEKVKKRGGG